MLADNFQIIDEPKIIEVLNQQFSKQLSVHTLQHPKPYVYANIENQLVFYLYETLKPKYPSITLPNYFEDTDTKKAIGAHLTLAYPEELVKQEFNLSTHLIHITYQSLLIATLNEKIYFIVKAKIDELVNIRKGLGLALPIMYKGHPVPPHITFARL